MVPSVLVIERSVIFEVLVSVQEMAAPETGVIAKPVAGLNTAADGRPVCRLLLSVQVMVLLYWLKLVVPDVFSVSV